MELSLSKDFLFEEYCQNHFSFSERLDKSVELEFRLRFELLKRI